MIGRRRMMMKQNDGLALFEDGEFNPILGTLSTSGFWELHPQAGSISINNENIVLKAPNWCALSWWFSNTIDITNYNYFCVEWVSIPQEDANSMALAGFTNNIVKTGTFDVAYPLGKRIINLVNAQQQQPGIYRTRMNNQTIEDKTSCYFSLAVNGWGVNLGEEYQIKKIWLE